MVTRRNFIKVLALVALFGYTGDLIAFEEKERVLDLYNIHTGERLNVQYYSSGLYDQKAIDEINRLLRCHYSNEIKPVDIEVIDLLCGVKNSVGSGEEVHIISGYRSPAYNEYLRSCGRGVVKDSLHLQGRAIDFCIPNVSNNRLSALAKSFFAGGVGTYPGFVHIDNGRMRYW